MGSAPAPRGESSPPDTRARAGVREVPIRVEGEHRPVLQEERINTNNTGQTNEHNFGEDPFTAKYFLSPSLDLFDMFLLAANSGPGYPIRLDKRPVGPRETPHFAKKQEYL